MLKELPVPPGMSEADDTAEIARLWVVDEDLHVTLSPGQWDDPAMWGILLVDLAKHVTLAYAQHYGMDPIEARARLREGFDAEWNQASD